MFFLFFFQNKRKCLGYYLYIFFEMDVLDPCTLPPPPPPVFGVVVLIPPAPRIAQWWMMWVVVLSMLVGVATLLCLFGSFFRVVSRFCGYLAHHRHGEHDRSLNPVPSPHHHHEEHDSPSSVPSPLQPKVNKAPNGISHGDRRSPWYQWYLGGGGYLRDAGVLG